MITGSSERSRIQPHRAEPVRSRQHQVEHDQARRLALEEVARRLAVAGLQRPVSLLLQVADDDVANDRLVVDDENSSHRLIVQSWRGQVLKGCLRTGPGCFENSVVS